MRSAPNLLSALCLALLACETSEDPTDEPQPTLPVQMPEPTWRGGVRDIVESKCQPCHTSYGFGDLLIETRGDLVDQPSTVGMLLIAPGDVDNSYVWHKLNDTQEEVGGEGERMPLDVAPLKEDELDLIRTWIEEGAVLE